MKQPVKDYIVGTVVNVEFPFQETEGTKLRPAVVISFNKLYTRVVLLQVTSQSPRTKYDYTVKDYKETGFTKNPSVVRCNVVLTVPNSTELQKKGVLSRRDLLAVTILYQKAVEEKKLNYCDDD